MKQNNSAIVYASIAVLSWSTVATAFKIALMHLTHFGMLLIASCTALALFITLLTIRKKWHLLISLSGRKWLYYALLGLLNPVGYYLVLFKAYDLLPAQIAQPVNYIWPIMLLILLALFTHHPIPSSKYIGMFISLLGVTLISWGTGYSGKETISYYGLLLALLSALLWAIYWMIQNKQKVVSLFLSASYLVRFIYSLRPMEWLQWYLPSKVFSREYISEVSRWVFLLSASALLCAGHPIRHSSISCVTLLRSYLFSLYRSF